MNLLVQNNYLHSDLGRFACAIGRAGLTTNKIEGDHKTPVGEFKFQKIYYRDFAVIWLFSNFIYLLHFDVEWALLDSNGSQKIR